MKNLLKNKRVILPIAVITSLACIGASIADPGSSSDPLISLSYFEDKIESLKDTLVEELTETFSKKFTDLEKDVDETLKEVSENGLSSSTEFKLITLGENETIICEAGTEIIVRSGRSVVVTSENSSGGISDITEGRDLPNGEQITNNHLLIIPKADGRGIKATISGAVMIKGNYKSSIEGI